MRPDHRRVDAAYSGLSTPELAPGKPDYHVLTSDWAEAQGHP
jgi:hypothetical protein